jgi:hypothetical protein
MGTMMPRKRGDEDGSEWDIFMREFRPARQRPVEKLGLTSRASAKARGL